MRSFSQNTPFLLQNERKTISLGRIIPNISHTGLIVIPFLTIFLPKSIIAIIALVLVIFGCANKNRVYIYPVMLFFYSQYGIVAGVSVYRIYSLLFIIAIIIESKGKIMWQKRILLPAIVMTIYCCYFAVSYNVRTGVFSIVDVICCICVVGCLCKDENTQKSFFTVFTATALFAFLYGLIFHTNMSTMWNFSGSLVNLSRFLSTFEDPNYMGFFYTIAVFSVYTLKLFNKISRIIIICLLYGIILSSLSISAIIVNIVLWIVYFGISGKLSLKMVFVFVFAIILFIIAYRYGLAHRNTPVLGGLAYRIEEKINSLMMHNYGVTTTNRTNMAMSHLQLFINQSFFKQLFGFNLSNVFVFDLGAYSYSAHNEYVDMLLNVGIIGTCILVSSVIIRTIKQMKQYLAGQVNSIIVVMLKLVWLSYAFTLTFFLDFRFMLFLFI